MADENTERYVIELSAQDRATPAVNQLNDTLARTERQALAVTAAGQSLADILSSPDAAAQLGITADELAQINQQLGITVSTAQDALLPFDELNQKAAETTRQVDAMAAAYDEAAKSIAAASNAQLGANDVSGSVDGGGSFNAARALTLGGRFVGGDVGSAARHAGQAIRLADMLPEDTAALTALGSAALIAAPALIADVAAFQAFNKEIQAEKDLLTAATTGVQAFYRAISEQDTTAQVTQKIEALTRQRDAEAQQLAQLQAAEDSAFQQSQQAFGDLGARLLDAKTPVAQLREEAEKLKPKVEADSAAIEAWTRGIQANAFAANDAAAASRAITSQNLSDEDEAQRLTARQRQERQEAIQRELNNIYDARRGAAPDVYNSYNPQIDNLKQEYADLGKYASTYADVLAYQAQVQQHLTATTQAVAEADSLTAEQRKTRVVEIEREIDRTQAQIDTTQRLIARGILAAGSTDALTQHLTDLQNEQIIVTDTTDSYADALARTAAATKNISDYFDAITNEVKIRDAITKTQGEIDQLYTDAGEKEAGYQADLQTKIGQIEDDGAAKRVEIAQNNVDAVARIEQTYARDHANAVGLRDALGAQQAEQRRSDDEANQAKANQRALDQEAAAEKKQLDQAQASYIQQEQALQQSLQKQVAAKQKELNQEQVDLTDALVAEIAIAESGATSMAQVHIDWWNTLNGITAAGVALVTKTYEDLFSGLALATPAPVYQTGTYYPPPVGADYSPTLPPVSGTAAASRPIIVNVNGMGKTLGDVLNSTLSMIDTLFEER